MKRYILISAILIGAICLSSCENENVAPTDSGKETTNITISIQTTARAASGTTEGTEDESKILNYEAYSFNDLGIMTGYVNNPNSESAVMPAVIGINNTVVVITNANPAIGRKKTDDTDFTLSELKKVMNSAEFSMSTPNTTLVPATGFEMTGVEESLTFMEGTNAVSVTVKRLVSKFVEPTFASPLALKIPSGDLITLFGLEENSDISSNDVTFTFNAYALANGANKSYMFKPADNWTPATWSPSGARPVTFLNSSFTSGQYDESGLYSGSFRDKDSDTPIYVYENYPTADYDKGAVKGYNPKEVYCFILKGTLTYNTTDKIRYWRVNLVRDSGEFGADEVEEDPGSFTEDHYCIHRNGIYYVTISSINSIGYETPEKAEKAEQMISLLDQAVVEVTVSVDDWDVYKTSTEI